MSVHYVKNKYFVFKGEKDAEEKYRSELSVLLIEKYGKGPFDDQETIKQIVVFSLEYYIDKFKEICHTEKSVRFYQQIFHFHEHATELAVLHAHQDISPDISGNYIASYRRILKFILEMGCEVPMVTGEKTDQNLRKRIEPIISDLIFLGEMIFTCVDLYAEQSMIEDVIEVTFDETEKYIFSRRHHYEFIFESIVKDLGSHLNKAIVDTSEYAGLSDLYDALENCFGIKYQDVGHLIASIHEELEPKGGEAVGVEWETFPTNLNNFFKVPKDVADQFFNGLRLDKSNKMDLLDLACKPYNLNRYLYRPIIIWNIDGEDFALLGKNSWTETFIQFTTNSIPWGKAPAEWIENDCFKAYVHTKEDEHDKWLEDAVEDTVKSLKLPFDRNIKSLNHRSGTTSIDVKGLGEVDFFLVSHDTQKIFIVDCKHLLGRYDIPNQRNDFNAFSIGSKKNKSYNETMTNKLKWFESNKEILIDHISALGTYDGNDLTDYRIEGIFIINTPTLYMYNAQYRIYTVNQVEDCLTGSIIDQEYAVYIEEEGEEKLFNIKYPYFQIPKYVNFDPLIDTEDE